MAVKIVTDSTCDIPPSIAAEYDITVIPCYINFSNQSFLDGIDLSREQFYQKLPSAKILPTTSSPGIGSFIQTYQKLADDGASGILSIHVPASFSNVVNTAKLAAESIQDIPVTVVDSGQLSMGIGYQAIAAAKAGADGKPMGEILALVNDMMKRTYVLATLDTLDYLRRSGRLNRMQANLGALLAVKPFVKLHNDQVILEPVRTFKKSINRLVSSIAELAPVEEIIFLHTHAAEKAARLMDMAQSFLPTGKTALLTEASSVIGIHLGPGAVGAACVLAERGWHDA
ncbi:MAG: DegV family protein [Anaerolineaceae bacterium]|nr:DegV family protein [Anaerolineaceae bacterium]